MTKLVRHGGVPTVFDEMHDMVNAIFNDSVFSPEFFKSNIGVGLDKQSFPKTDMIQEDGKIVLECDIHGLKKEDVSVDLEPSENRNETYLIISGGKKEKADDKDRKYIRKEIKRSSWRRSWILDEKRFDVSKVKADVVDGLLVVEIPEHTRKDTKVSTKIL
jgi:HSP20 family molecular chaperone IbpA